MVQGSSSWFDRQFGESPDWSQLTKNTFINCAPHEVSEKEHTAFRRQRSAPAKVVARRDMHEHSSEAGQKSEEAGNKFVCQTSKHSITDNNSLYGETMHSSGQSKSVCGKRKKRVSWLDEQPGDHMEKSQLMQNAIIHYIVDESDEEKDISLRLEQSDSLAFARRRSTLEQSELEQAETRRAMLEQTLTFAEEADAISRGIIREAVAFRWIRHRGVRKCATVFGHSRIWPCLRSGRSHSRRRGRSIAMSSSSRGSSASATGHRSSRSSSNECSQDCQQHQRRSSVTSKACCSMRTASSTSVRRRGKSNVEQSRDADLGSKESGGIGAFDAPKTQGLHLPCGAATDEAPLVELQGAHVAVDVPAGQQCKPSSFDQLHRQQKSEGGCPPRSKQHGIELLNRFAALDTETHNCTEEATGNAAPDERDDHQPTEANIAQESETAEQSHQPEKHLYTCDATIINGNQAECAELEMPRNSKNDSADQASVTPTKAALAKRRRRKLPSAPAVVAKTNQKEFDTIGIMPETVVDDARPVEKTTAVPTAPDRQLNKLQGHMLAVMSARLNEAAIARHLRSASQRHCELAVTVDDPIAIECPDVLHLELGSVVRCEAVDSSGWGFGTVLAPASMEGRRGCFLQKAMRVVMAHMYERSGVGGAGSSVELAEGSWKDVDKHQDRNTVNRLRQKAVLGRMRAARAAWEKRLVAK